MKKRITPQQRRHQDYLRQKGLKVGKVYMNRLAALRRKEVRRVLDLCAQYNDPMQWRSIVENNLTESGYIYDWYKGLYLQVGLPQASSVTRDLTRAKATAPTGAWEDAIDEYATTRAGSNVVIVSDTLKNELQGIISATIEADENIGIESLTRKIYREWSADVCLWQCRRIAQTETMIGLAEAGDIAARELDIPFVKEWCISGVGNTRETHEIMDGVVVADSEPFQLADCMMMYPHDSSMGAPAGEIINCACSCIRIPK